MNQSNKMPKIFFVFFAVVVLVNVFYIYISKKTWRGLATENSYQKGVKYNDVIDQVRKQNHLAWRVEIKNIQTKKKESLIKIYVKDKNLLPIKNCEVIAKFKRPTQDGYDFNTILKFKNDSYQSEIIFPLYGQWDVQIEIRKNDDLFIESKRLNLNPNLFSK